MLLMLLAAYVVLKPFYFFPSGLPQVADAFLTLALAIVLIRPTPHLQADASRVVLWAGLFAAWVAAVNLGWAVYRSDPEFLLPPVFYLYDVALVFLVLRLHAAHGERLVRVLMWSTAVAVYLQSALALVVGGGGTPRSSLFFNNPNQLGYWALLSGSIFFVCALRVPVRIRWQIPFALASLYLVALSLSKAAMLSLAALLVLAVVRRPARLLPAMLLALVVFAAVAETEIFERVQTRLAGIGEQTDDSITSRGYDRLWTHPEHLILGAGEGGYERFRRWDDAEFHSTLGTLVFSYGVVGAFLIGTFLLGLGRRVGWYGLAFLAPALLFGVSHQGLRFSTLWLLFGAIGAVRASPHTARQRAWRARRVVAEPVVASPGPS